MEKRTYVVDLKVWQPEYQFHQQERQSFWHSQLCYSAINSEPKHAEIVFTLDCLPSSVCDWQKTMFDFHTLLGFGMFLIISHVWEKKINDRKIFDRKTIWRQTLLSVSIFLIYSILWLEISYTCVLRCDLELHFDCFSLLSVSIMLICLHARNLFTSSQSFFPYSLCKKLPLGFRPVWPYSWWR